MRFITALLVLFMAVASLPAYAYVGPGPGLTMIGSLLALVGSVVLALLMVVVYPVRLMMKRRKKAAPAPEETK